MEVAFRSDHGADILGVPDLTVCRQPVQQLMAAVVPILHPTALPMVEVEPGNLVNYHKSWRQRSHHQSEGRSCHCKVISVCARGRLEEVACGKVVWNDRVLESPKMLGRTPLHVGGKSHCKYETTRRTALPDAPGHASGFPCKFTLCHGVAVDHMRRNCRTNTGNSAFSRTWKIQEWLTIGCAAAKSVRRLPDSCGAHAACATQECCSSFAWTKYISVLDMYTPDGVPVKAIANRRGDNLAITSTQRKRARYVW